MCGSRWFQLFQFRTPMAENEYTNTHKHAYTHTLSHTYKHLQGTLSRPPYEHCSNKSFSSLPPDEMHNGCCKSAIFAPDGTYPEQSDQRLLVRFVRTKDCWYVPSGAKIAQQLCTSS